MSGRQVARLAVGTGRGRVRVAVTVTPAGLVAVGALVSSILLSAAALVRAAAGAKRAAVPKHDDPSAPDTLRGDL